MKQGAGPLPSTPGSSGFPQPTGRYQFLWIYIYNIRGSYHQVGFIYVCVCVCVCACVWCAYMCARACVCMCVCARVCAYVCVRASVRVHMCVLVF